MTRAGSYSPKASVTYSLDLSGDFQDPGATPSTVANIQAGGTTLLAGVVSVAILAVMVLALGDFVASIPNAVLAGILVKVALDTIDWRFVMRVHKVQREHMVVMLLTLGLTVFWTWSRPWRWE